MRSLLITIFTLTLLLNFFVTPVLGQTPCKSDGTNVCLLQPDVLGTGGRPTETSLGNYLSLLFKTLIGLAGGISALIIVVSGLQYMLSEVPGVKTSAKGHIQEALTGLVLALAAYLILYTISPDLTKLDLNLTQIKDLPKTTTP